MQVRTNSDYDAQLTTLARLNRRTLPKEVDVAIEAYLAANRELLKKGPRLSRTKEKAK